MQKNVRYFISFNDRAYRSELALFRHERSTAGNALIVRAPAGASQLYMVEGRRGGLSVTEDLEKAGAKLCRIRGVALTSIPVVR